MFNGKMKAITFSYDDGITQDLRLIELFNKYGIKATFNLNSELFGRKDELELLGVKVKHHKVDKKDVKEIYEGHEVAVHTLTHPYLQAMDDENEIIRQVEEDRKNLEDLVGYKVCGMAFPNDGKNPERVSRIIKEKTEIKYVRTTDETFNFEPQTNLHIFKPTIYHGHFDEMTKLAEEFISLKTDTPKIFYIWGHSYEFDIFNNWDKFEDFLKLVSNKDDIFYGTNKEVLL